MGDSEKVFPPSYFIKAAMRERNLTQKDLAAITDRHPSDISARLSKERITYDFASDLALVLGQTPEYWKTLEVRYRATITPESDKEKVNRNTITQHYPLKDMQKRGWISKTDDFKIVEKEIEGLIFLRFGGKDLEKSACFKRTVKEDHLSYPEKAWLHRAWYLASMLPNSTYNESRLPQLLAKLKAAIKSSKSVQFVADLLQRYGIRFVVIEPLPKVRIDGVSFWIDDNSPVVALSLRFDNVGSFWYALIHELIHIKHRDRAIPNNLEEEPLDTIEKRASGEASDFLVPQSQLKTFIRTNKPYFSTAKINDFATSIQVHPGIIVGQLQHLREIGFNQHHASMAKIRELVTVTAFTDGWGHPLPNVKYEAER
jgi:HTH-type transcriptional regulator/antitoxin HigA